MIRWYLGAHGWGGVGRGCMLPWGGILFSPGVGIRVIACTPCERCWAVACIHGIGLLRMNLLKDRIKVYRQCVL